MLIFCAEVNDKYTFIKDVDIPTAIDMCRKSYYNPHPSLIILEYQWGIENSSLEYWYRQQLYSLRNDDIVALYRLPFRKSETPIEKNTLSNTKRKPIIPNATLIPIDILLEDD